MVKLNLTEKELSGFRTRVIPYWLKKTIDEDYDQFIIIVGKEGVGKSTLALILGGLVIDARNKKLNRNDIFDVRKSVYFNLQKLEEDVFSDSQKGDVRIVDEGAITGGYKRQAMTKDNKSLNETLMTCRSKNQIIIFLIPSINELDRGLRRRASAIIRVVDRGRAWVYHEKESNRMIYWNTKYKRIKFKYGTKPFLNKERYRTVQKIMGETVWNHYLNHKESSLRYRHAPKIPIADTKYRRPKDIMDMFGVKEHTIKKLAKADSVDKIRDTRGWLFNVASVKSYINQEQPSTTRSEHILGVYAREDGKK